MSENETTTEKRINEWPAYESAFESGERDRALNIALQEDVLSAEMFWRIQDGVRAGFDEHGRKYSEWTSRQNKAWIRMESWPQHYWPRSAPGVAPAAVALIGCAYEWRLAPWGRPGWELWGLNDVQTEYGRPPIGAFTRWFQVHNPEYMARHYKRGIDLMRSEWTRETGVRLYMDRAYEEYPDSEPLPLAAVEALTPRGWYHCSSFDWMLALALHEGFRKIMLVGVDFYTPPIFNAEPLSARPCLEYWVGVCDGRGVEVELIGPGGHLFKNLHLALRQSSLQYGFEREPALDLAAEDQAWMDVR